MMTLTSVAILATLLGIIVLDEPFGASLIIGGRLPHTGRRRASGAHLFSDGVRPWTRR